jgi:adenylylsulfate kinase-like enzyme
MTKEKTTENGTGSVHDGAVHLVLQGKGGVGKSVVASWLAEFLLNSGKPVCCVDGDPVNRSLGQYKALRAEKLDLVNQDGLVQRTRYDNLLERFATDDAAFVVDSGATAFMPFWTYVAETEMVAVLREAGRQVYVHVPICGGEMLNDTLLGFKTLAESTTERSLVLWINEYFGPVARDGKCFEQMQVYLDNQEKVLGSIGIPQRSPDTYGDTIRLMREKKLTFAEAIESADFMLAQRSRLHIVRRDLFEQLQRLPFA